MKTDSQRIEEFVGYLHVYGQVEWHGDAYIVGDAIALKSLRDAIDCALSHEGKASMASYVNDGESFYLAVVRVDSPDVLLKLAVPYLDGMAKETRAEAIFPEQMQQAQQCIQGDLLQKSLTPLEQATIADSDRAHEMWEKEVLKAREGGYEAPPPFETMNAADIWISQNEQRERALVARRQGRMISQGTFVFLQTAYEEAVENFLDDPDEQFTGWRSHAEFLEWYVGMLRIGKEIGKEFWVVAAAECTEDEIARVKAMLKAAAYKGEGC